MTTIRSFCCNDLLRFTPIHLDHLAATAPLSFYITYLALWRNYFHVAVAPGNRIIAYIVGKVEGEGVFRHGHVSAVTVAPEYRRQGLATKLMEMFEYRRDLDENAYFLDLLVAVSNTPAITFLQKLGFHVFTHKPELYADGEDAFEMRKTLTQGILDMMN